MAYRSDIRVITTKDGFEELKKIINQRIEENLGIYNPLEYIEINKKFKDIVYIGWNYIRLSDTEFIDEVVNSLKDKDITYRIAILGESINDIEENYHTAEKDDKRYIPYPSIKRDFDEKDMNRLLKEYIKELDETENEL